jgi:5'-nucleotidase
MLGGAPATDRTTAGAGAVGLSQHIGRVGAVAGESMFVLGVDLDGVCADHTAAFREVVAAELSVDPATLGPQQAWDYHAWGVDDEAFLRIHKKAVLEYRMFRTMPPIAGVAEALWNLSDAGVWIRLITHRLYTNWGHQVAVSDTVAWLDEHGIPYRDLCMLGDKPQVEAGAYIEDAPHNVEALRGTGNPVVVFDQPYNRHLDGLRARTWAEAEQIVLDLVAASGTPVQGQFSGFPPPADRLRHHET